AIPPYRITLGEILTHSRSSRAAQCSNAQRALKRAWERLLKVPLHGAYITDIMRWTCDCGSQKYHANLLCKHLVQAVGALHADWWPTAVCYHIQPFYTVPIDRKIAPPPETMRDHSWTERMRSKRSAIIVRPTRYRTPSNADDSDPDVDIPGMDRRQGSSPILSSPDKAPHTGRDGIPRTRTEDGSEYELEDEADLDSDAIECALQEAVAIITEQAKNPEPRFLRSAIRCSLRGTIRWVCARDTQPMPDLEAISAEDAIMFLER
ncbi:hypothetical protein C2E23DRAFT_709350, partial [Lenzites betulinus]